MSNRHKAKSARAGARPLGAVNLRASTQEHYWAPAKGAVNLRARTHEHYRAPAKPPIDPQRFTIAWECHTSLSNRHKA